MVARLCILGITVFPLAPPTWVGQGKAKAARESAEYVMRKFGKEAAHEGVETLTRKMETLAIKHGDDAFQAVRRVGPRTFRIVEEAGMHGPQSVKLLAKYGDEAVWVVAKPNRLAICAKLGDEAAEAMMKHGEIAEPLLQSIGKPAAGALKAVSSQSARRLAMMAEDGGLAQIGKTPMLLELVTKYGDRAMEFVWRHKGSLTVGAALTAFLANPEPFLEGAKDFTKIVAESAVKPIVEVPGQVASQAAKETNWTTVAVTFVCMSGLLVGMRLWLNQRRRAT